MKLFVCWKSSPYYYWSLLSAAGSPSQADAAAAEPEAKDEVVKEMITFKVIYNKQKFDVTFPLDATVASLKSHIETLTSKLLFSGKHVNLLKWYIQ